jgi:hypothetical protein
LLLEEHRGSWWRRLVFLVRRKGGVMYGWDEGTRCFRLARLWWLKNCDCWSWLHTGVDD